MKKPYLRVYEWTRRPISKIEADIEEQGIDSFHILEDLVPIEEQMEYFRYFDRIRRENRAFVRNEEVALCFPEEPVERKKRSLILFGIYSRCRSSSIETYHSSPLEPELSHWASMHW